MVYLNNLSYDAWEEYLKSDKEMNSKWKSLTELWENVKKDLKESLNSLPYSEALRRRKFLTAKNIFNVINTAKEKPNFAWDRKLIYNEEDERDEYVIQCIKPSSDFIFKQIKEERGVTNMHWSSIDKYLQPVADQIWALKTAVNVSINPETVESKLSYESLKTKVSNDDGNEVDPDYPKPQEGWTDPTQPWTESSWFEEESVQEEIEGKNESTKKWKKSPKKDDDGQLSIPFPDFDN